MTRDYNSVDKHSDTAPFDLKDLSLPDSRSTMVLSTPIIRMNPIPELVGHSL